jgi:hypothetical protein
VPARHGCARRLIRIYIDHWQSLLEFKTLDRAWLQCLLTEQQWTIAAGAKHLRPAPEA